VAGDDLGDIAPWHLWERHRVHAEHRKQYLAMAKVHQDAVAPVLALADFHSWKDFYNADVRRRGDDVVVGEVTDGELHWKLCWHSGTQEVVAYGDSWVDERWFRVIVAGGSQSSQGANVGYADLGTARVPEVIYVLGRSQSADRATELLESARDLNHARALLLNP
jgi:hypothetical protein